MSQLFQRKPIAKLVEDTEGTQSLKRSLGAGDLIMLRCLVDGSMIRVP